MKTDDFLVSNGGEEDPCWVLISQLVLKTIPHALQLNSLKKTSVDDIEGDVDQCEVSISQPKLKTMLLSLQLTPFTFKWGLRLVFVLTPMFNHIYGNLESK